MRIGTFDPRVRSIDRGVYRGEQREAAGQSRHGGAQFRDRTHARVMRFEFEGLVRIEVVVDRRGRGYAA